MVVMVERHIVGKYMVEGTEGRRDVSHAQRPRGPADMSNVKVSAVVLG